MTIPDQIKLINDLVKEDDQATIKDYVDALAEIDWIGQTTAEREHIKRVAAMGLIYKRRNKIDNYE